MRKLVVREAEKGRRGEGEKAGVESYMSSLRGLLSSSLCAHRQHEKEDVKSGRADTYWILVSDMMESVCAVDAVGRGGQCSRESTFSSA